MKKSWVVGIVCLALVVAVAGLFFARGTTSRGASDESSSDALSDAAKVATDATYEAPASVTNTEWSALTSEERSSILEDEGTANDAVPGEVIVSFKADVPSDVSDQVISDLGARIEDRLNDADNGVIYLLDVSDVNTVASVRSTLETSPYVLSTDPNTRLYPAADSISTLANDPYATSGSQSYLDAIGLPAAWAKLDSTSHSTVKVAVLDSGVFVTHEDIQTNLDLATSYDAYHTTDLSAPASLTSNVASGDARGHGTNVCGVLAATTNNALGIVGVGTGDDNSVVKLSAIKIADDTTGGGSNASSLIKGLSLARAVGARVVNISYDGTGTNTSMKTACDNAVAAGVTIVCAAGNGSTSTPWYPCSYDSVISVVNLTSSNDWSTRSSTSNYGSTCDISAPGTGLMSISNTGASAYSTVSGTSFSSPVVAGVAALLYAEYPKLTDAQVKSILYGTATDIYATGYDTDSGWGRVNAGAALGAASDAPSALTVTLEPNGGALDEGVSTAVSVMRGSTYGTLPSPSRTGYSFIGWYTDAMDGHPVLSTTKVTATDDHILYAHWKADPVITFDVQASDVTAPASQTVAWGGTVTDPSTLAASAGWTVGSTTVRAGYSFRGWFADAACTTPYDFSSAVIADATLYAKWDVATGSLEISKQLGDATTEAQAATEFEMQVTLADATGAALTGSYPWARSDGASGTLALTDGIGTVTLKGGQTVTISDLPEGTTYQVSETNAGDGWTTAWTDAKVAS